MEGQDWKGMFFYIQIVYQMKILVFLFWGNLMKMNYILWYLKF